ncbi:unnamed protein product, partial [Cyprideis torosa]
SDLQIIPSSGHELSTSNSDLTVTGSARHGPTASRVRRALSGLGQDLSETTHAQRSLRVRSYARGNAGWMGGIDGDGTLSDEDEGTTPREEETGTLTAPEERGSPSGSLGDLASSHSSDEEDTVRDQPSHSAAAAVPPLDFTPIYSRGWTSQLPPPATQMQPTQDPYAGPSQRPGLVQSEGYTEPSVPDSGIYYTRNMDLNDLNVSEEEQGYLRGHNSESSV